MITLPEKWDVTIIFDGWQSKNMVEKSQTNAASLGSQTVEKGFTNVTSVIMYLLRQATLRHIVSSLTFILSFCIYKFPFTKYTINLIRSPNSVMITKYLPIGNEDNTSWRNLEDDNDNSGGCVNIDDNLSQFTWVAVGLQNWPAPEPGSNFSPRTEQFNIEKSLWWLF